MNTKNNIFQRWSNLPIWRKQLIGLFSSEAISIFGLVGVGAFLIVMGGRSVLINQAKSELAVTDIKYNIKINQMKFGFRGQSDNPAIIAAAKARGKSQVLGLDLEKRVKQILQNEIKAREIEYATLVDKDSRIIVNANANRTGEIFNPNKLVTEAIKSSQQIKSCEILNWEELQKESPPLPLGLENQPILIRYVVTPVKDPNTKEVIGALISGDIVNRKFPIVDQAVASQNGGYSGVYLRSESGKFTLATAALDVRQTSETEEKEVSQNKYLHHVALPNDALLFEAVKASGETVTKRISIKGKTYTVAAKTVINLTGKPIGVLIRGTPETELNLLLKNSLLLQGVIAALALLIDIGLALLLGRTIANPIKRLQKTTQDFSQGNQQARAEISSNDEIGELAKSFNLMAD
ncbi:MAG: HAMP domain-containing protein [Rivularia sp. (in: cyanobacteria)]